MSGNGPLGSRRSSLVQKRNPKKSSTQSENGTSATATATNGSFSKPLSPVHSTLVQLIVFINLILFVLLIKLWFLCVVLVVVRGRWRSWDYRKLLPFLRELLCLMLVGEWLLGGLMLCYWPMLMLCFRALLQTRFPFTEE